MDADERLPVAHQVGLAMRAGRRELGLSQRSFGDRTGLDKSAVARLETRAGRLALDDVQDALEVAGFELVVVPRGVPVEQPAWCPTDLVARTRGGSRFAAHHAVYRTGLGPLWWWADEFLRPRRRTGPRPEWTTEGARLAGRPPRLGLTYGYGDRVWGTRRESDADDDRTG